MTYNVFGGTLNLAPSCFIVYMMIHGAALFISSACMHDLSVVFTISVQSAVLPP